ncbi:hypothetical protein P4O66_002556 [Electrophorus voltai]|uniref:Uncharacterized protein n=1 Tax=Electrophorus voltai TaxID=2609070 RepID=A0AAD8YY60_9TELE|nr:hypothetical protein P4O66_002556 [Electrophorus voltai]
MGESLLCGRAAVCPRGCDRAPVSVRCVRQARETGNAECLRLTRTDMSASSRSGRHAVTCGHSTFETFEHLLVPMTRSRVNGSERADIVALARLDVTVERACLLQQQKGVARCVTQSNNASRPRSDNPKVHENSEQTAVPSAGSSSLNT